MVQQREMQFVERNVAKETIGMKSNHATEERKRQLREELKRGYEEMAAINLSIVGEMFQIETEAEFSLLRQVSGV